MKGYPSLATIVACGSERDSYVVNNGPVIYYVEGGGYKTGEGGVLNFTKQKGIGGGHSRF